MKTITKIRIKIFLTKLLFEIVVNLSILSIAYLCGRFLETLLFYLSWQVFRLCVPKVFHIRVSTPLKNIIGCLFSSILSFMVAMKLMFPIQISIFSGVIVGISINFLFYKIQDYIDLKTEMSKNAINIYSMTEDELRNYAKSKGLSEMIIDTLVLRVINNYRWCEIQQERNYTREGIKYHRQRIYKVLNVKL